MHQKTNTPTLPIPLYINDLTHDGRGVATYDERFLTTDFADRVGKKIFVNFALPNETVFVAITNQKSKFDEGDCWQVVQSSPNRTTPICPHFTVCGGCNLQHFDGDEQLVFKRSVVAEQFAKLGLVVPTWLVPIVGERIGYRTKARLGVRYLPKQKKLIVGFRQQASNFLTDIKTCPILDKRANERLLDLKNLLNTLAGKAHITHLELAMGDDKPNNIAMVVRHLRPLNQADQAKLITFGQRYDWQIYLQPKGVDSVYPLFVKGQVGLSYHLPDFGIQLYSYPTDFTQVNLSVNRQMVALACQLLDLKKGETVLDLFCGLGNFSLAMATLVGKTGKVIGVEGSKVMVKRAKDNAKLNGLTQCQFFAYDLTKDFSNEPWVGQVDALLIDPPRSGAMEVMAYLANFNAKRIVYVSCDPATLARDSVRLAEQGYRLTHAGVMDMFSQTGHIESIVRFEKITDETQKINKSF